MPIAIHLIFLCYPTQTALNVVYLVTWLIPSFFIRLIVNTLIVNEISSLITSKRSTDDSIGTIMATILYDICLVMFLTAQSLLFSVIHPLYFFHSCLLMSFISFDYKWASHNIQVPFRIKFFNQHWSYFVGFGFILAALEFLLPFPYNGSLLSFMASLMLIVSDQLVLDDMEPSDYKVDIFTFPSWMSGLIFDEVLWFVLMGWKPLYRRWKKRICFWYSWK